MIAEVVETKDRIAQILLIEDNYGDVLLTKKAFASAAVKSNITVAIDGEQALTILRRQAPHQNAPLPDLILLDLNLPKRSGQEILQDIKADDGLKHIPVIILSSSEDEAEIIKSYELHAASYIVKPVDPRKFAEVARKIGQFWFEAAAMPHVHE